MKKIKLLKVYVSKPFVLPFVIVLLLLASIFGMDLYNTLSSGYYHSRFGDSIPRYEDPWGYWIGVFYESSLVFAFIYFALNVRSKNIYEKDEKEEEIRKL